MPHIMKTKQYPNKKETVSSNVSRNVCRSDLQSVHRQLHRMDLFIQMRVLLHYLARVDPSLRTKVNLVLKACYRKNQCKNTKHESLTTLIDKHVRKEVGEKHWKIAEKLAKKFRQTCYSRYLSSKNTFVPQIGLEEDFQLLKITDWSI